MGDAMRREQTTTVVCYELTLPTNAVEVDKAISWAARDLAEHRGVERDQLYDDDLTVNSDGEQLVISWVKK